MKTLSLNYLKIVMTGLAIAVMSPAAFSQDSSSLGHGIPLLSPGNSGWTLYDDDWDGEKTFGNLSAASDPDNGVKQILVITGDFSSGGRFAGALYQLSNVDIDSVSMQVKSRDCSSIDIRVFDADNQCFEFTYAIEKGVSWHPVSLSIKKLISEMVGNERPYTDKVTTWNHWGGRNDGKWRGKATGISFMIARLLDHPVISASLGDITLMRDSSASDGLSSNTQ